MLVIYLLHDICSEKKNVYVVLINRNRREKKDYDEQECRCVPLEH